MEPKIWSFNEFMVTSRERVLRFVSLCNDDLKLHVVKKFSLPLYVRLNKTYISQIKVNLINLDGITIPFAHPVRLLLHIKEYGDKTFSFEG